MKNSAVGLLAVRMVGIFKVLGGLSDPCWRPALRV